MSGQLDTLLTEIICFLFGKKKKTKKKKTKKNLSFKRMEGNISILTFSKRMVLLVLYFYFLFF